MKSVCKVIEEVSLWYLWISKVNTSKIPEPVGLQGGGLSLQTSGQCRLD